MTAKRYDPSLSATCSALYGHADQWVRLPASGFLLVFYTYSSLSPNCIVCELEAWDRRTHERTDRSIAGAVIKRYTNLRFFTSLFTYAYLNIWAEIVDCLRSE